MLLSLVFLSLVVLVIMTGMSMNCSLSLLEVEAVTTPLLLLERKYGSSNDDDSLLCKLFNNTREGCSMTGNG